MPVDEAWLPEIAKQSTTTESEIAVSSGEAGPSWPRAKSSSSAVPASLESQALRRVYPKFTRSFGEGVIVRHPIIVSLLQGFGMAQKRLTTSKDCVTLVVAAASSWELLKFGVSLEQHFCCGTQVCRFGCVTSVVVDPPCSVRCSPHVSHCISSWFHFPCIQAVSKLQSLISCGSNCDGHSRVHTRHGIQVSHRHRSSLPKFISWYRVIHMFLAQGEVCLFA